MRKTVITVGLLILLTGVISTARMIYPESGIIGVNGTDIYTAPPTKPYTSLSENLSSIVQVSDSVGNVLSSDIAVDPKGNVHIAWEDTSGGDKDILYRMFNYTSQTWGPILNLSDFSGYGTGDQTTAAIAVDEDCNIWVVWIDVYDTYAIKGRYYNASTGSWGPLRTITAGASGIYNYDLTIANSTGGNFTIAYSRAVTSSIYRIYYREFDRNTNLWSAPLYVAGGGYDRQPSLYFDGDNNGHMVFVYRESTTDDIYTIAYCNRKWDPAEGAYVFGSDGVLNVTQNLVYNISTYHSEYPTVIADPDTAQIYVTWQDQWNSTGKKQVRMINMTLDSSISQISLNSYVYNITNSLVADHLNPRITFCYNTSNIAFIWNEYTTNGKIVFKKSMDAAPIEISSTALSPIIYSTEKPKVDFGPRFSPNIIYIGAQSIGGTSNIYYRKLDVWGPNLKVNYPTNNTMTSGVVTFDVETEPDTVEVTYEWYNDTDANGVADDGNTWNLIANISNPSDKNFDTEWNTTDPQPTDYLHILIRINATDVNGLTQSELIGNVTIDNQPPQTVEIVAIWDEKGHFSYVNGTDTLYLCGNVIIQFNVYDNTTGIGKVELYNGTTLIMDNSTAPNATVIVWDTSSGNFDGIYNNLYIRAYDRGGNHKDGQPLNFTVIIDNSPPQGQFVDLVAGAEYSGTVKLNITVTTDDTENVKYYYYNATINRTSAVYIGTAVYFSGKWIFGWDTTPPTICDGVYTIIGKITDHTGWTTEIEISIVIDNTPPSPFIITPLIGQEVGLRVLVKARSDPDTEKMIFQNSSSQFGPWTTFNESNIYTEEGGYRYFISFFDAYSLSEGTHYLRVIGIDNQGLENATLALAIKITKKFPYPVTTISAAYIYDPETKSYNITIKWSSPKNEWNITHYAIFRVREKPDIFDIDMLNAMTPIERFNYLGNFEGDKYYIKDYPVEQITDYSSHTYTYNDTGLFASTYYYIIIGINVYGNPSNITKVITVHIPAENPDKQINLTEIQALPILFIIYTGFMAVFTVVSVKSAKTKQIAREKKRKLVEMYEKKLTVEEVSIEEKLEEMEKIAEEKIMEKVEGKDKKKKKLKEKKVVPKTEEESFLDMVIAPGPQEKKDEGEEEVGAVATSGPRRCPNCGWIVSSKAIKCPRCGELL